MDCENKMQHESEEKFRSLFSGNRDGIVFVDENGRFLDANRSYCDMTGYSIEELKEMKDFYFLTPEKWHLPEKEIWNRKLLTDGYSGLYEKEYICKDGSIIPVELHAFSVADSSGKVKYLWAVVRNIAERKLAESSLRESEQKFRLLIENSHDVIYTVSTEGIFTYVSPSWSMLLGHMVNQVVGKSYKLFVHPDDVPGFIIRIKKLFETGERQESIEYRVLHANGTWYCHSSNVVRLEDENGVVTGFEGIAKDITEKKQSEAEIKTKNQKLEALNEELQATMEMMGKKNDEMLEVTVALQEKEKTLRESEERFRNMFENHSAVMLLIDPENGRIIDSNKSAVNFYGYDKSTLDSLSIHSINILSVEMVKERYRSAIVEKQNYFEFPHKLSNGDIRIVEVHSSPVIYEGRNILFSIIHDITERKKIEQALKESEEKYKHYVENAPDAVFISDEKGRFVEVNKAASQITGYIREELLHMSFDDLVIYESLDADLDYLITLAETDTIRGELQLRHKDGISRWVSFGAVKISESRFLDFMKDITDSKLAKDKIRSLLAEKEIILKEVHHRIKNFMNNIRGLLLLQADSQRDSSVAFALHDAVNRIQSMSLLYDKLFTSSDFREMSVDEYLSSLVDEIVDNFPNRNMVKVVKRIDDIILEVNKLQPIGIIVNELITNIMKYAFAGRSDGLIEVFLTMPGERLCLVIRDNGIGIPDSITFENSTGFGMQLVSMLAVQIGAALKIERGEGTTFILDFDV